MVCNWQTKDVTACKCTSGCQVIHLFVQLLLFKQVSSKSRVGNKCFQPYLGGEVHLKWPPTDIQSRGIPWIAPIASKRSSSQQLLDWFLMIWFGRAFHWDYAVRGSPSIGTKLEQRHNLLGESRTLNLTEPFQIHSYLCYHRFWSASWRLSKSTSSHSSLIKCLRASYFPGRWAKCRDERPQTCETRFGWVAQLSAFHTVMLTYCFLSGKWEILSKHFSDFDFWNRVQCMPSGRGWEAFWLRNNKVIIVIVFILRNFNPSKVQ